MPFQCLSQLFALGLPDLGDYRNIMITMSIIHSSGDLMRKAMVQLGSVHCLCDMQVDEFKRIC